MLSGDHRAMGCCVTGLADVSSGALLTRGTALYLFQVSQHLSAANLQSGRYRRRLKYHWCPTEDNEAIFFYLPSNGHLWSHPGGHQPATTSTAQQQGVSVHRVKLTDDKSWVELPPHSLFCLYKKSLSSRILSRALHTTLSFRQ